MLPSIFTDAFIVHIFAQHHTAVPPTPLATNSVLKEETEAWPEVQEEMTRSLATMRVDYDQVIKKRMCSYHTLHTPGIVVRDKSFNFIIFYRWP